MPVLEFDCEQPFTNVVIEVDFRFHRGPGREQHEQRRGVSHFADEFQVESRRLRRLHLGEPGQRTASPAWSSNTTNGGGTASPPWTTNHSASKPDKWYRVRMELIGNAVLAHCNGVTVYGTFEKFGMPKTSVPLGSGYCVHDFRRFRIYGAKPDPKWQRRLQENNAGESAVIGNR